jgi:phospholipid N-methyltransferase
MFSIELDGVDAIVKKLDEMRQKIDHFKRVDIGTELSAWQMDDLHRHGHPFTMRSRAKGTATTVVRPHSLYEMIKSEGVELEQKPLHHFIRVLNKRLRHKLPRGRKLVLRRHRHWSTRPILRSALEQQLWDRMVRLLREKIKW